MLFYQCQNRGTYLIFRHRHDPVEILFACPVSKFPRLFHRYPVCNRRHCVQAFYFLVFEAPQHAWCPTGLYAIHLYLRVQSLDGKGDSTGQSSASYRHNHCIHVRQLFNQLQTNRSLSGYHLLVVERMYEGVPEFITQFQSLAVGVIVHAGYQTNVGPQPTCSLHLTDWCPLWQAYQRFNAIFGSPECHPLGMIPGRAGNHALSLLLIAQLRYLITSSP